jgi:hypothetical protein
MRKSAFGVQPQFAHLVILILIPILAWTTFLPLPGFTWLYLPLPSFALNTTGAAKCPVFGH